MALMKHSKFISSQSRRVLVGILFGSIGAAIWHLISRDSVFLPTIRLAWRKLGLTHDFDGFRAYTPELSVAFIALLAIILIPGTRYIWRFMRAWWAGITSVTTTLAAVLTVVILLYGGHHQGIGIPFAVILLAVAIHCEYWRQKTPPASQFSNDLKLKIPEQASGPTRNQPWVLGSSDDPIDKWEQDILGRAAVVELLADYALRNRTPILALCGDFGDGKTSVLNLLRQAVEDRAIVVSFSAWLPGSETTLATDLFRDIVTECRKCVHVSQLRKHAVAYARTLSGSFSYLAGLREILPPQSQREEIDELREALALVPLPILVLLDDVDRMQREEILVLLKILRGAASIPNVTFVCAFSEREVKKALEKDGSLSDDYLEKFFPVTVNLAPPASDVLGALFREKLTDVFRQQNWFPNHESVKKFSELLERVWSDSLSRICTNMRKITLLLNDILIAARPITGEVNAFDLAVIETIRCFYPDVYRTVRTNPLFLTYATNDWSKGRLLVEDEKKEKSREFFKSFMTTISKTEDPTAIEAMLSWIFPDFAAAKTKGASFFAIARPTSAEIAEAERRICDPDYFPIYFRAAIPQEMFSNAELANIIRDLTGAKTESAVESIFSRTLDEIPKGHPKRDDFLLKISRALDEVDNLTAERVAFAAATRAADYAYDMMNFGEAARALNIVFVVAQKLSGSSKAQEILEGAMARATDDTFAKRLLEFTQDRMRNRILTDFLNIDTDKVKHSFLERMRRRYGPSADINHVDILKGDWWAFRIWSENSPEDAKMEQVFWRDFVGASRKRLAQTINFVYPGGNAIWSVDPRTIVDKLFPTVEMAQLLKELPAENLEEVEEKGIQRFEALLQGKYPSHAGDFI